MNNTSTPIPTTAPRLSAEVPGGHGAGGQPPPAAAPAAVPQWLSMAGVGHELRTPLGALSAALEVIALAPHPMPIQSEACAVAARQTRHLSSLLEDLQDVLAAREGRMELRRVALDFSELARQAWEALVNSNGGYDCTQQIAPGLRVMADPRLMRRVIDQLLCRACKAGAPGMRMDLTVSTQGGEVRVEAHGLPRDDMGRPSGTACPLNLHVRIGVPATLADLLADHVIQLHGGRIAPLADEEGRYLALPCLAEAPPPPARLRRPKVLIALHDGQDRQAAGQTLERQGYLVLEGTAMQPALDLLLQNVPDLVLASAQPAAAARHLATAAREAGYAGCMVAVAPAMHSEQEALDTAGARRAGFDAWAAWADWPQVVTDMLESRSD
ncbi:hybrid sensor histidine kinase/response regulator [Acidovorax sp. SUPP1855]|uniref:sensor histidine kinase n=1 Tax=Acidovorax sp. SUPP1855 TaxID=431774 RepID=UPI0023DE5129|nr:HAMP domain-containing sensor histidine kinase [Acidovorax sp. SUPP1855]GKS85640.1 hybrid sensor histidine kinase/response regulator [Acidovorax sp. SUPP1855]